MATEGPSSNSQQLIAINAANQLPLKLTPTNYYSWKTQFDAMLYGYDLLGYIDGSTPCPPATIISNGKQEPNPAHNFWMRQDKLLFLGIIGSLSPSVVPIFQSCSTSIEAWQKLAKNYANPSSSRIMGLAEQLTLLSRGTLPVANYLAQVRDIADELTLLGAPVPLQYLITHTLNGVAHVFKELAAVVRAQDTVISFHELHDKLVEYEAFLKREELRASGTFGSTGSITVNAARFSNTNGASHGKKSNSIGKGQYKNKSFSNNSNQQCNNHDGSGGFSKPPIVCQFCEKKGHTARQCYTAKRLFFPSSSPQANAINTSSSQPWLLDTGVSHHVTTDLSNLTLSQQYDGPDDVVIGIFPRGHFSRLDGARTTFMSGLTFVHHRSTNKLMLGSKLHLLVSTIGLGILRSKSSSNSLVKILSLFIPLPVFSHVTLVFVIRHISCHLVCLVLVAVVL